MRALALQPDGRVLVGGDFASYNGAAAPARLLRLTADGALNNAATPPTGLTYTWSTGATGASIAVSQPGDYVATASVPGGGSYSTLVRVSAPSAVSVALAPAGPLALPAGGSATLTATATRLAFNAGGSGFNGIVYALAVQPDGKVLVGGDFTAYNGNAAAPDYVLRLHPDGALDTGFNPSGGGANGIVRALALLPDGKVAVGGNFTAYNGNAAAPDRVLRLNADGTLDAGFNPGAAAGANDYVYALAAQPDSKVLVGGTFSAFNGSSTAPRRVLRLGTDGSLDTGFNPGGTGADGVVWALAVQPDGKVLVGGTLATYNGDPAAPNCVLRLTADGALDADFNRGGAGTNSVVYALAVQPDGKVLAGGTFSAYNGDLAAPDRVLRLNANGSLDAGFNAGGTGADSYLLALAVQPDGKVLAGGNFASYNGDAAAPDAVLRLNANGTLDTGFNYGGAGSVLVQTVALQADGRVLAGGGAVVYNGNYAAPDGLVRVNADGLLNDAATAVPGATFVIGPGTTAGPARLVSTAGTYTATATDPATGCAYASNAVVVTITLVVAPGAAAPALRLYPNPVPGGAATLTGAPPGSTVTVLDALGRTVTTATPDAAGMAPLVLPAGTPAGVYVVRAGGKAVKLTVE
ncbi:hypothetical protein Q5H92_15815 [Hymenobacter sp. M29]|uniref:Secretion system C-terminal sorting domain-containing protein n=1 Tax=Hymenobacter mellowenesis TaxID=3063995 RepID=A0ABT9AE52_9BACT|nr:hypothetical protein [Hymenobacter sp. M29]MDO7847833.1 hypothetical protein [Hymenobacter sp. M29]